MVITVQQLHKRPNGPVIEFDSPWGSMMGRWMGPAPEVGQSYLVELDISDTLRWDRSIRSIPTCPLKVSARSDYLIIEGPCEDVHDDGSVIMRLGKSLLMIETSGRPPLGCSHVSIECGGFSIFPISQITNSGTGSKTAMPIPVI